MTRGALWFAALTALAALVACGTPDPRADAPRPMADAGAPDDAGVAVDRVEIVEGVPDHGRDPAVVALDVGGEGLCSGALISSRLVMTARHCVARTVDEVACPADRVQILGERDPASISVLLGDDVASARPVAHGIDVVAPSGATLCDSDIAILVLDDDVPLVKPLPVRRRGPALGDHVRAVGFGKRGDLDPAAGVKIVREHVLVRSVSAAEFTVGEATCQGDSGGPALDESNGAVVGIVSRGGPSCEGAGVHNVYTRADAFAWLVDEAFARVAGLPRAEDADAGETSKPKPGTNHKPPSDIGGPCESGDDCAAGVCITTGERRYCSRPCGTGDRCPNTYHCQPIPDGGQACINVR